MKININNSTFNVNPSEERFFGFWDEVNSGKWEPYSFYSMNKFLNNNSVIVDIGAWIGPLTLYAATISKKVYAIEPDAVAYSELLRNIEANSHYKEKISTHKICIYNENKTINLWNDSVMGNSGSSIVESKMEHKNSIPVESQTLNYFLENNKIVHVDYLKIDIEGAETKVIPNISDYLIKNKPVLHLSMHPTFFKNDSDIKDIIAVLKFAKNVFFKGIEININSLIPRIDFYEIICVF